MNFKSVLNDVCCDNRIKNGVIDLKNEDHVFILQEYLENAGFDIDTIVEKTAKLFEAGRFPERQAYNKDGILVTFPSKEYRDRAVNKGTHFAENPKKAQANIFATPPVDVQPEEPKGSVPVDTELDKDIEDEKEDGYEDRTPKEKVADAQAVDAILTGETPLVNYSVDEAKRYGFYNKGMLWYDTDGNLIGEQIFDEARGGTVIKQKAQADLNTLNKFQKALENTKRNADVLETFPILKCFGINDRDSLKKFVNDGGLDKYDFKSKSKSWIRSVVPLLENEFINNLFFQFYNSIAGTNASLNNISNEKVTSFIHDSVDKYKEFLKVKTNVDGDSKANTSDVILIYGGSMMDLFTELSKITSEQDLIIGKNGLISFKKNPNLKFAQVSLKKGEARLGKITKRFFSMIDASDSQPADLEERFIKNLNEGAVTDLITSLKDKINTAGEYLSKKMSDTYNWFITKTKTFYELVTNIFRSIPMNEIEQQDKKLEELTINLENANEASVEGINEESLKPVPITDCNYLAMTQFYEYYKKIGFKDLIKTYKSFTSVKKAGGFNIKVSDIDDQHYIQIDTAIKNIYEIFYNAAKTKNFFKEQISTIESKGRSCNPTGKIITRQQLEPALKLRANHIALRKIDEFLKSLKTGASSTNVDFKDLPSVAASLSAEAVFGNNTNLPLFKFDGKNLMYLGDRQHYTEKKRIQFLSHDMSDMSLGYIHVYQTQKQSALHFQVYMYLLFDLEGDEKNLTPLYSEIAFTVGSGSKFAFNVEMNKVVSLEQVKSKMESL